MRKTNATFSVTGVHIDGKTEGTLTVEAPRAGITLVSYRPWGSRKEYTLTIGEVAEMIAWRVAKKEAGR